MGGDCALERNQEDPDFQQYNGTNE